MRVIVKVYDKRFNYGTGLRGKNFDDIKEAFKWAKNLNNKVSNWVTIIDNGRAYNTRL